MNSKLKIIFLPSILFLLTSLLGCNESAQRQPDASGPPDMIRRAQLVGQENIQLKRQIETLKAEIDDLKKQVEAEQTENARIMAQHSDIYTGLMRHLLDCSTKLEALQNN